MLLTITTTARPATDLGFLLYKHPGKVQAFDQAYGTAHVFYPEAGEERCTAALLLEVDPVRLVRTRGRAMPDFTLGQYVNDRPYAASSLLSTAMAGVFRTAMRGRCDPRPELAAAPLPLELHLPAVPCRGGSDSAIALFAPLGWRVVAEPVPLDDGFPEWGDSRYVTLTLTGEVRLADALNQLYVLLPVLDDAKHYWVAPDEVDKLIRAGDGWLASHPERARIVRRYLADRGSLVRTALGRLADADDAPEDALDRDSIDEEPPPVPDDPPPVPEHGAPAGSLSERRIQAVLDQLGAAGARRVIDLGCGSGKLLSRLLPDSSYAKITGTDVSYRAIQLAARRLRKGVQPHGDQERLELFQGALTYADERFRGYDAAVLMEVIEHIDPPRLEAVERVVFGDARPGTVIVTTPNAEYNVRYEGLTGLRHGSFRGDDPPGPPALRHSDHRFEWTRAEFRTWAERAARAHGYQVRYLPVGDEDAQVGAPTQMGVFTR